MNNIPKPRSKPPRRDARQRVLAEWRGLDVAPEERTRAFVAKTTRQLVPQVLARLGLDRRRGELEILKAWNNLLDPNVVAHARPVNLHKGTLFVQVDNSVWLSEIVRYRRKEILERLQHCFGKEVILRISFRAG